MRLLDRLRVKILSVTMSEGYGINPSFEDFWSRAIVLADAKNRTRLAGGRTTVFADMEGTVPAGLYTVLYEGTRGPTLSPAELRTRGEGADVWYVEPGLSGLRIEGEARMIRLPNSSGDFYQPFMDLMRKLRPVFIRTLDWNRANDRVVDKPTVSARLQATLCRELGCDLHYVVHHMWTPDEVRANLKEIASVLPGKRVTIEFSNEIWNPGFPQYRDLRPDGDRPFSYVGARLRELWGIADEELPGNKRFVGGWIAQPSFLRSMLEAADSRVDYAGPATYVGPSPEDLTALRGERVVTAETLHDCCVRRIADMEAKLQGNVAVAREFGAIPYLYECGQDLKPGSEEWRSVALAMQGSELMGDVYKRLRLLHARAGIRRAGWYSLMTSWTPGKPQGPFGLLESMADEPKEVPKCREAFKLV